MAWVIFNPDVTDIETFVEEKAPSKILRKDGYAWIYVSSKTKSQIKALNERDEDDDEDQDEYEDEDVGEDEDGDGDGDGEGDGHGDGYGDEDDASQGMDDNIKTSKLMRGWDALLESGGPSVTYEEVCELAKANSCMSGKWLVFESPAAKLDEAWANIARATAKGNLGSAAKVSTRVGDNTQVICVYNDDFTDRDSVLNLEKGLRHIGIGMPLHYKLDVYTHLGIYAKNVWNIKPTICYSCYDVEKEQWNVQFKTKNEMSNPSLFSKVTAGTNRVSGRRFRKSTSAKHGPRTSKAADAKTQSKLTDFFVPRPSTSHQSDVAHSSSTEQELTYHQPHRQKRVASDEETDESTKTKVPKV